MAIKVPSTVDKDLSKYARALQQLAAGEFNTNLVTQYNLVQYSAQSLTAAQQTQVQANISAVSYASQTLTAPQQTQAQTNISAVSYAAQTLTAPQQTQAKTNISAVGYSTQSLTSTDAVGSPSQQTQARENVYAAPFDALSYNGIQTNGSMEISQPNAGNLIPVPVNTIVKTLDGWEAVCGGPVLAVQQVQDAPPGYVNSQKVTVTTADPSPAAADYAEIVHAVEGIRASRLAFGTANAQPLSIAFWCKANRTGTYSLYVSSATGTLRFYVTTFTVISSGTWEYKTVTIPGDTSATGTWPNNNTAAMQVGIGLMSGTTYATTPNVWTTGTFVTATGSTNGVAATTDYFQITGLVMLPGIEVPSATRAPHIMRPFDQELTICKRYWQASYDYGIIPGAVNSGGALGSINPNSVNFWANVSYAKFAPFMRTDPTVTIYSPVTGAAGKVRQVNAGADVAAGILYFGMQGCMVYVANVSTAGNDVVIAHWVADARM